ncbi:MAG: hypothetical protein KBF71_04255 [Alphaproteobacteria bacterium]|jgi:flagellin-like hook-associated protein FlgL|nr:hypothetical protein [Alphaproteobacteria bacterium]
MTITRVATSSIRELMLKSANKGRGQIADYETQIATQQKASRYTDMVGHLPKFNFVQNEIAKIGQYKENMDNVLARIQSTEGVLNSVYRMLDEMTTMTIQARNPGNQNGRIDLIAQNYKAELANALNRSIAGVYLFGGNEISIPPVDINPSNDNQAALATGQYYVGSGKSLNATTDGSTVLDYGLKADDDWATYFFSGLQRIIDQPNDHVALGLALDDVNRAMDELTQAMAKVGHQMKTFEQAKEDHVAFETIYQEDIITMNGADVPYAMARITDLILSQEGIFSLIAKESRLSLADYLQ